MPTFTQTAFSQPAVNYQQVQPNQSIFSQPAVHFQQTQPTQTNQTEKEKYEIWDLRRWSIGYRMLIQIFGDCLAREHPKRCLKIHTDANMAELLTTKALMDQDLGWIWLVSAGSTMILLAYFCCHSQPDAVSEKLHTPDELICEVAEVFYPIRATLLESMLRHRLTVPPSYCRDVVVAGNIIQMVQAGLRQAYECIASAPIACTARQMVFSSPWLTAKKESAHHCKRLELASPEQTATGKDMLNPLYGCDGLPKTVRVFQFTLDSRSEKLDWFLLEAAFLLMLPPPFDLAVHRVHAVHAFPLMLLFSDLLYGFLLLVLLLLMFVSADGIKCFSLGNSSSVSAGYIIEFMLEDLEAVPADYVPADLIYRRDYCMLEL
ncbi:hypothetical protein Tco_0374549 [Tanacetum coccineum]